MSFAASGRVLVSAAQSEVPFLSSAIARGPRRLRTARLGFNGKAAHDRAFFHLSYSSGKIPRKSSLSLRNSAGEFWPC
jgi:hypothetical protein